ncbi:MAG: hypothetical protein ACLQVD_20875 [Capsulimonadaceae bacterium]
MANLQFSSVPAGIVVDKTFTISNTGGAPLYLSSLNVPAGFLLISVPTNPVPPLGSTQFAVRYEGAPGTMSGPIVLDSDDPRYSVAGSTTPDFRFTIADTTSTTAVEPTVPQGGSTLINLNFNQSIPTADWYVVDPNGLIVGSDDPAMPGANGWTVSLSATVNGPNATVGTPLTAVVASGYQIYVGGDAPVDAAVFAVIPAPPVAGQTTLSASASGNSVNRR